MKMASVLNVDFSPVAVFSSARPVTFSPSPRISVTIVFMRKETLPFAFTRSTIA